MSEQSRTVAVLVANPALSSILSVTLASSPYLRVRPFESQIALTTYLRLAPVDLIVCDFDSVEARADLLAEHLRHDGTFERRDFQIIALASTLTPDIKRASIHAGIDEIIMKPMSPRYLVERVISRLTRRAAQIAAASGYHGPERRDRLPAAPRRATAGRALATMSCRCLAARRSLSRNTDQSASQPLLGCAINQLILFHISSTESANWT